MAMQRAGWAEAPSVAQVLTIVVFGSISVLACIRVAYSDVSALGKVLCICYVIALLAIQVLWMSPRSAELPQRVRYSVLGAQAFLVYVPILQYDDAWLSQPGFLAGSALIVLPAVLRWAFAWAVVASIGVIEGLDGAPAVDVAYWLLSTALTGLVMYGLTWFVAVVTELQAAREELATAAVARERLRVARDLHDLLGYSLSAITLKIELTHRLMSTNPARAQAELAEVLPICRQALADVRAVARSYRDMSLERECESARRILTAADVRVTLDLGYRDLPVRIATVLGIVLREGITNLLRHSAATWCEISVRQAGAEVTFEVRNDGALPSAPTDGGSGLPNLSGRVAELGGALTAERQPGDTFRLRATLPASETAVAALSP